MSCSVSKIDGEQLVVAKAVDDNFRSGRQEARPVHPKIPRLQVQKSTTRTRKRRAVHQQYARNLVIL
ncbi:hypothetical protein OWV82_003448 [Melia azedarach]|uniref:Uncharacterized protein n=1 Tax=Melia azedarach TaxID=155640 RepID=A0ACC1YM10_MELAZ|nr:hypothetical protein OWV82_003448 [Melia azedarach]